MRYILIILLFIASESFGQVSLTPDSAYNAVGSTNSLTIVSPSIPAETGHYLVALVHGRVSSGTSAVPSLSGLNVTWQEVATVTYDNGTGGVRRITAFLGICTSSTTSALTATWLVNNHQRYIQVFRVMGAAKTNNGLDGLAQAITNTGNSAAPSITMATRTANSAAYAFYGITQDAGTAATDAPYADLSTGYGPISAFSQPITLMFPYQNGGTDNTPSLTLSGAYDFAVIALEFKPRIRRIISAN